MSSSSSSSTSRYRYRVHVPQRSNADLFLAGVAANLERFQARKGERQSREAAEGDAAAAVAALVIGKNPAKNSNHADLGVNLVHK